MLKQQFHRFNEFNKKHKRFVKPNDFEAKNFNIKLRYIDEESEKEAERNFKMKYSEDIKDAHEEVAEKNNASNRLILIIASILMFLVWLILR